ncbi:DUF3572 domain-containing protein [Parvibaculum sp.]|uniref:DUF3572 domain-containing protein n=1 Tax=Parvibaculum sp. TaxID=2024848 RepID=UPI002C0D3F20|nr:DUF3572 domain-containing protein [Parvibaculum sp.]HUD52203.1 DUF3572 domain-containing protein [Parvibaculum sp.]
MKPEQAEIIAIQALGHIAGDDELLYAFLDITGLPPEELRIRAAEPEILGGVLDFLLMDEKRLLSFCEAADLPPELPGVARKLLPGGEEVHWT